MNTVMQFLQATFPLLVLLFTVSNLGAMGLQVKMPEVIVALQNKKSLALIFVWGWVVGPTFGYLITRVLPLAEPYVIVLYGQGMLDTVGQFALLSMTLFMVGMGLITYRFGFDLKQNQRSVMALGMGTRNVAAVLAAALAIPNADPLIVTMTVMWTLWSVVLAAIGAKIFAKQAGKAVMGGEA